MADTTKDLDTAMLATGSDEKKTKSLILSPHDRQRICIALSALAMAHEKDAAKQLDRGMYDVGRQLHEEAVYLVCDLRVTFGSVDDNPMEAEYRAQREIANQMTFGDEADRMLREALVDPPKEPDARKTGNTNRKTETKGTSK